MKKLYTLFSLAFLSVSQLNAQNYLLNFDGVNDYVDIGSSAITGTRTVELWFTPGLTITPTSLSDYSSLLVRQDATQNDEFNLMFDPTSAGTYAGRLVFQRNVGGVYSYVASNANTWNAGICYHVAGVIDPVSGMKMYINGVLQTDTNPFTGAPAASSEICSIGRWGDLAIRYFTGKIDEVRLWSYARSAAEVSGAFQYTVPGTISGLTGYWNFNEGSGTTANDVSVNSNNGTISGAMYSTSGSCIVGVEEELQKSEFDLNVYPNPLNESTIINVKKPEGVNYTLSVTDVSGKLIWSQAELDQKEVAIGNLITLNGGVYFVTVTLNNANASSISTKLMVK